MKTHSLIIALVGILTLLSFESKAQGEQKFVTFSGFVIDSNTDEPLPGAFIINHRAGKGVQTNSKGYFIMDVFPGDSLVFSYLGFSPQYYTIPKQTGPTYSAVVELSVNAKMLKEVKVYPFRTEEEFRLAFLNMDSPNESERKIIEKNLGSETLRSLAMNAPMSSMGNYRYAIEQQNNHLLNQKFTTLNPLMNVGSWANFIKTVKSGQFVKGITTKLATPTERNTRDEIFKAAKEKSN